MCLLYFTLAFNLLMWSFSCLLLLASPSLPAPNFSFFFCFSLSTWFFQFSSIAQSCWTLCDPMNHSTPGLPVHHQLPESTQTHVHRVDDAIQPSHPLSSHSPPALNLSQLQGLFQWVFSCKLLEHNRSEKIPSFPHTAQMRILKSSEAKWFVHGQAISKTWKHTI